MFEHVGIEVVSHVVCNSCRDVVSDVACVACKCHCEVVSAVVACWCSMSFGCGIAGASSAQTSNAVRHRLHRDRWLVHTRGSDVVA
jgi:hypothetical protein